MAVPFFFACKGASPHCLQVFLFDKLYKRKGDIVGGFSYKQQYAVVVICTDEKEQETVYNRLKEEGYKLKVVAV